MGLWTYDDFKTALKFRHGGNDAFDSYYGTWVNLGYRQLVTMDRMWGIKRSLYFPEIEVNTDKTTVASTATIDKPTDCISVREVYDATNNVHLEWQSWNNYVAKTDRYTSTGKPTFWHHKGNYLYLYPTPDDAYTMRVYYRQIPAALSGASDVTAIGVEWDDVVLDFADYQSRMWTREYEIAKTVKDAASARVAELVTVYDDEEKARRERLRPDEQGIWTPTY